MTVPWSKVEEIKLNDLLLFKPPSNRRDENALNRFPKYIATDE